MNNPSSVSGLTLAWSYLLAGPCEPSRNEDLWRLASRSRELKLVALRFNLLHKSASPLVQKEDGLEDGLISASVLATPTGQIRFHAWMQHLAKPLSSGFIKHPDYPETAWAPEGVFQGLGLRATRLSHAEFGLDFLEDPALRVAYRPRLLMGAPGR